MSRPEQKLHNNSIDLFRLLCAVMVISIHTAPLSDVSEGLGDLSTNILPRIAVPYFFATAGYFYICQLEEGKAPMRPYLKRIITTYLIWSIPYWLISFLTWGYRNPISFTYECIYSFFIDGSSYHFWFFPALMLSACLCSALYKIGGRRLLLPISLALYAVGCLCCAYPDLALRLPPLKVLRGFSQFLLIRRYLLMGFPFFASGALARNLAARKLSNKTLLFGTSILVLLWSLEILAVRHFQRECDIVITFGLYPLTVSVILFLLRHPLPDQQQSAAACRYAANFMYYAHPLTIILLQVLADTLSLPLTQTPLFLLVVILTAAAGLLIHSGNHPMLKRLIR